MSFNFYGNCFLLTVSWIMNKTQSSLSQNNQEKVINTLLNVNVCCMCIYIYIYIYMYWRGGGVGAYVGTGAYLPMMAVL